MTFIDKFLKQAETIISTKNQGHAPHEVYFLVLIRQNDRALASFLENNGVDPEILARTLQKQVNILYNIPMQKNNFAQELEEDWKESSDDIEHCGHIIEAIMNAIENAEIAGREEPNAIDICASLLRSLDQHKPSIFQKLGMTDDFFAKKGYGIDLEKQSAQETMYNFVDTVPETMLKNIFQRALLEIPEIKRLIEHSDELDQENRL